VTLGSDDGLRVFLNGQEVHRNPARRGAALGQDRVDLHLRAGENVLVLKVVNEVNSWQACARFLNGTTPVTNLRISLTPR
jgi:hypothetical protein